MLKKISKMVAWFLGTILLLVAGCIVYVYFFIAIEPPTPFSLAAMDYKIMEVDSGLFKIKDNWFRKSESGLYELYVEGEPFERGVANGKLTKNLVEHQEEVFTKQLRRLVPSDMYRNLLKHGIRWFNRNMDDNIPEEYKLEIYGVSRSASPEFDNIDTPYQRMRGRSRNTINLKLVLFRNIVIHISVEPADGMLQ